MPPQQNNVGAASEGKGAYRGRPGQAIPSAREIIHGCTPALFPMSAFPLHEIDFNPKGTSAISPPGVTLLFGSETVIGVNGDTVTSAGWGPKVRFRKSEGI